MKFSGREVMFPTLKIKPNAVNVAEVHGEKVDGDVEILKVDTRRANMDPEARVGVSIFSS